MKFPRLDRTLSLLIVVAIVALTSAVVQATNYYGTFFAATLGVKATAVTADLASVGATACITATPTVSGVKAGDVIEVALPNSASALTLQHQAIGTADNTILDKICNPTNGAIDPTSQRYVYFPIRPTGY
jgi:hypothetical protein